ncbi:catalase-related domain-containing protein [Polaribacter sp. Hel1_85]|uniref:catalase-related domain-containing protein n=1 Tax=Polaribacter sp. Hel1_85 TaxID=1250005 RepID=UPI00052C2B25|nr:catalase-related domain-containing protein [Polaribacter sp. Hel1_85]KGL63806.1 hypothetical protein PHEL85_0847 [Polaribacter sp. Hel1_85]
MIDEKKKPTSELDLLEENELYTQPGNIFRMMSTEQQQVLFKNTARQLSGVEEFVQQRHIANCYIVDSEYGTGVAKALGIDLKNLF